MTKRILVVEDQPDNRQIIRDMLAPTDYEITEAENGEEALTAIAKQRPDLILISNYRSWMVTPPRGNCLFLQFCAREQQFEKIIGIIGMVWSADSASI